MYTTIFCIYREESAIKQLNEIKCLKFYVRVQLLSVAYFIGIRFLIFLERILNSCKMRMQYNIMSCEATHLYY